MELAGGHIKKGIRLWIVDLC